MNDSVNTAVTNAPLPDAIRSLHEEIRTFEIDEQCYQAGKNTLAWHLVQASAANIFEVASEIPASLRHLVVPEIGRFRDLTHQFFDGKDVTWPQVMEAFAAVKVAILALESGYAGPATEPLPDAVRRLEQVTRRKASLA